MQLRTRELYCPAHFGNSYEVMGRAEMRHWLNETAWWGFTRYGDWFDTLDLSDPYAERHHHHLAHALWDRKRAAFQAAQAAGLETTLTITPNHVLVDQVRPEVAAVKGDRVFGQLVCPSKPAGREVILANYRRLFADLAGCGVGLTTIAPGPYDYGGCLCADCDPWIVTFAGLCRDLLRLARRHHPEVALHPIGWWWAPHEHELFADWADREMPGEVRSITLHIPYGQVRAAQVMLPSNCNLRAFIHDGYADQAEPRDVYGKWGPVVAPRRIPATLAALAEQGAEGFMAYSEGVYEDVNRCLLGALSSGKCATADEALRLYAERYFGATGQAAADWSTWLQAWGTPFAADCAALRPAWEGLSRRATPSWRLDQWGHKLRLLELHHQIGGGDAWSAARLELADAFMDELEVLQRRVWGVGPLRHIFGEKFLMPGWFASYRKARGLPGDTGQVPDEA